MTQPARALAVGGFAALVCVLGFKVLPLPAVGVVGVISGLALDSFLRRKRAS